MIGSPPGYVGYDEGGQLTEMVRRRPYSIVLLDEIEKAHPDVFNILLQILDDGRLTDTKGRVVNFKNTVIIMTSNVGSDVIYRMHQVGFKSDKKQTGPSEKEMRQKVMDQLRNQFKPEFLNRIDETIIFHPVGIDMLREIVTLQFQNIAHRLKKRGISLELEGSAKEYLTEKGLDPIYGARPLKRLIQHEILDPLAMQMINGEIQEGDIIQIEKDEHGIVLRKHKE